MRKFREKDSYQKSKKAGIGGVGKSLFIIIANWCTIMRWIGDVYDWDTDFLTYCRREWGDYCKGLQYTWSFQTALICCWNCSSVASALSTSCLTEFLPSFVNFLRYCDSLKRINFLSYWEHFSEQNQVSMRYSIN